MPEMPTKRRQLCKGGLRTAVVKFPRDRRPGNPAGTRGLDSRRSAPLLVGGRQLAELRLPDARPSGRAQRPRAQTTPAMKIRFPTERTPPHLWSFVTCLGGVIFLVLGTAGLLVAWSLGEEESVRQVLLSYGGVLFVVGGLTVLAC